MGEICNWPRISSIQLAGPWCIFIRLLSLMRTRNLHGRGVRLYQQQQEGIPLNRKWAVLRHHRGVAHGIGGGRRIHGGRIQTPDFTGNWVPCRKAQQQDFRLQHHMLHRGDQCLLYHQNQHQQSCRNRSLNRGHLHLNLMNSLLGGHGRILILIFSECWERIWFFLQAPNVRKKLNRRLLKDRV